MAVRLGGQEMPMSENFQYLGSIIYKDGAIEEISTIG